MLARLSYAACSLQCAVKNLSTVLSLVIAALLIAQCGVWSKNMDAANVLMFESGKDFFSLSDR